MEAVRSVSFYSLSLPRQAGTCLRRDDGLLPFFLQKLATRSPFLLRAWCGADGPLAFPLQLLFYTQNVNILVQNPPISASLHITATPVRSKRHLQHDVKQSATKLPAAPRQEHLHGKHSSLPLSWLVEDGETDLRLGCTAITVGTSPIRQFR